ncbi:MAG TPA: hypothetical protein VH308_01510 [Terracidiphilus sp.]|jgi:hypothetical protein|nr:hypothetical protein [Terracidiphilus sp.]
MNLCEVRTTVQSAQPALELISLARLSPEHARHNLRTLLLANPNYFGKITGNSFKAVLKIQQETTYESLACVRYNPRFEQLQATVSINQNIGYSSAQCRYGSDEHVRFYLSYDGGSTWKDQGLRTVNVYDTRGRKPAEYRVSVGIGPAQTFCFMQKPPLVRAILSWNSPPPADTPEWAPVWGNVIEAQIQIPEFGLIRTNRSDMAASVGLMHETAPSRDQAQPLNSVFTEAAALTGMTGGAAA